MAFVLAWCSKQACSLRSLLDHTERVRKRRKERERERVRRGGPRGPRFFDQHPSLVLLTECKCGEQSRLPTGLKSGRRDRGLDQRSIAWIRLEKKHAAPSWRPLCQLPPRRSMDSWRYNKNLTTFTFFNSLLIFSFIRACLCSIILQTGYSKSTVNKTWKKYILENRASSDASPRVFNLSWLVSIPPTKGHPLLSYWTWQSHIHIEFSPQEN